MSSKRYDSSTTTTSEWPRWRQRRRGRNSSSLSRRENREKGRGGPSTIRTPGRFVTANSSRRAFERPARSSVAVQETKCKTCWLIVRFCETGADDPLKNPTCPGREG